MNLLAGEQGSCVVSGGGSTFSGAPLSLTLIKCQKHCRDCGDACQCMMNGKDIKTGEPVEGVEQPDAGVHGGGGETPLPVQPEIPGGYGGDLTSPSDSNGDENLADLDTSAPTDLPEATDASDSESSGGDLDGINLGGGELGEENLSDEDMGDDDMNFGDDNSDYGDDDDDMEDFGMDANGDDSADGYGDDSAAGYGDDSAAGYGDGSADGYGDDSAAGYGDDSVGGY